MRNKTWTESDKESLYALYQQARAEGKKKAEAHKELAGVTGKTPSAISSLIWRIENEGPKPRKEKTPPTKPTVEEKFDPVKFLNHYHKLVEENMTMKAELESLRGEFEKLYKALGKALKQKGLVVKLVKDPETNTYIVERKEKNGKV